MSGTDARLAAWFENHEWRVQDALSGQAVSSDGIRATYDHGAFEIAAPGVFISPLGHRGRRGFILERTDGAQCDLPVEAAFGETTLRRAQAAFGPIAGLPAQSPLDSEQPSMSNYGSAGNNFPSGVRHALSSDSAVTGQGIPS